MNIKKITAFAAAFIVAAGICTGVPIGTEKGSFLAVTASANTVSKSYPKEMAEELHLPENYSATSNNNTIEVKWDSVSGAKSYNVRLMKQWEDDHFFEEVDFKTVTTTSCNFSNIPDGTYSVGITTSNFGAGVVLENVIVTGKEKDTGNTGNIGSSSNITTDEYNILPANYSATGGNGKIDVKWDKVNGAKSYTISYSEAGVNSFMYAGSPTSTNYTINNLTNGKAYDIMITPDSLDNSYNYCVILYSVPVGNTGTNTAQPSAKEEKKEDSVVKDREKDLSEKENKKTKASAPSDIKASRTSSSVTLTWSKAKGAVSYRVLKYNGKTGKYEKYKDLKDTKCTVTGLKANTKYKFKVVSYSNENGRYVKGESSEEVSVTTKK